MEPGLHTLGAPTPDCPVLVTANYTLSFDALRSALSGVDAYILALDTKGINVWCAAGKGTFGTDEIVRRVEATGLREVVNHRELILPQLGAPGVAAHEVKARSGFRVHYGPVRADDLPAHLETREATPEMRRVRFSFVDRLILIPVELVRVALPTLLAAVAAFLIAGSRGSAAVLASVLAGTTLFPILLPWIPTEEFSTKGFILGATVALPFVAAALISRLDAASWLVASEAVAYLLSMPPVTAFLALSFTGSTTFTSRSGVRGEIFAYVPVMASTFSVGILLAILVIAVRVLGGVS